MVNKGTVDSFRQIKSRWPVWVRARAFIQDMSMRCRMPAKSFASEGFSIRFIFYHHVFEDERKDFSRQLRYLRKFGEFISLDDAVLLLKNRGGAAGHYFCVTFDDGIASCYDWAFPILIENDVSAAFFVMPEYMAHHPACSRRLCKPMPGLDFNVEYFSWEEARLMADAGMIIGSHTCSHARLSDITDDACRAELKMSKEIIERNIGKPCRHFACPWGRSNVDFYEEPHVGIAREAGYHSFLTVQKGIMGHGDHSYFIKRNFVRADFGDYKLRYLLDL